MRWGHLVRGVVTLALVGGASGCTQSSRSATEPEPASRPTSASTCQVGPKLVPSCGVLLGVTAPQPSSASLRRTERTIGGERFAIVYHFHDVNDITPNADEKGLARTGRILRFTIESRDYASPDRSSVTWADVAAGRYDKGLEAQARGIAALGRPVFVTFSHEPDQPQRTGIGDPADFVAAWRHVHDLFDRQGASRAVWVWSVTGWPRTYERALSTWPGNPYVDWIGWEAYNKSGCATGAIKPKQWRSFAQAALPFYRWIWNHGPSRGIDTSKPMMLGEVASVSHPTDRQAVRRWYSAIPGVIKQFPQIKAVTIWDHVGTGQNCDYRLSHNPGAAAAVSGLLRDPFMRHSKAR